MCTDTMAVYMCVKCNTPYCGGKVECADEMKVDKDKMVCHDCRWKEAQEAGGGKCSISVYFTTCYPNVGSRRLQTLTTLHSHTRLFLPAKCHNLSEQCTINVRSNTRQQVLSRPNVFAHSMRSLTSSLLQSFNPQSSPPTPHFNASQLLPCLFPQLPPSIPQFATLSLVNRFNSSIPQPLNPSTPQPLALSLPPPPFYRQLATAARSMVPSSRSSSVTRAAVWPPSTAATTTTATDATTWPAQPRTFPAQGRGSAR